MKIFGIFTKQLSTNISFVEYDPNPLLSLSKRKRRASTSVSIEERLPLKAEAPREQRKPEMVQSEKIVEVTQSEISTHKERKKLKKHKKDKLRLKVLCESKKKKKKHRCVEDNCKHRKHHKKHRKRKKHHHGSREREGNPEKIEEEEVIIEESVNEGRASTPEELNTEQREESTTDENTMESYDGFQEYVVANPEDEVTLDDVLEAKKKVGMRSVTKLFETMFYWKLIIIFVKNKL